MDWNCSSNGNSAFFVLGLISIPSYLKNVTYERCKHCWFTTQRRFINCYKVKLLIKFDWKITDPHIENTFLNIMGILVWKRVVLNFPKSFPVVLCQGSVNEHKSYCTDTIKSSSDERRQTYNIINYFFALV